MDLAWGQTRSRYRARRERGILAGSEPGAADRRPTMQTQKIFLASSSELKEDRREFEIFIHRKNREWVGRGVFLDLIMWEDFLDALSPTRLQDEYNKAIRECDVFVMVIDMGMAPLKTSRMRRPRHRSASPTGAASSSRPTRGPGAW